ncbi:MAG: hypothetical protein ACK5LK_11125 [Chthoniobacterales bacterium]
MKSFFLEPLARPACRLPLVNTQTFFLPERHCLAAMNISDEGRDARIFLVNTDTLESEWHPAPEGESGPYGFVLGADGNLYVSFFGGRIYRFIFEEKRFCLLADPFAGQTPRRLAWGSGASRAGRLYFGVYPTGEFVEYEIASGEWRIVVPSPDVTFGLYANQFQELPDGRMLVLLYGARAEFLIYDPVKAEIVSRWKVAKENQGKLRSLCLLDEERVIYSVGETIRTFNFVTGEWEADFLTEAPDTLRWVAWQGDRLMACGVYRSDVYELTHGLCRKIRTGLQTGNIPNGGVFEIARDTFACFGDNGMVVKFSGKGEPLQSTQIDNTSDWGMNVCSLKKLPGSNLAVGAHFISSQIFSVDLESGVSHSSLDKVTPRLGQIMRFTYLNGVVYFAAYVNANVFAWQVKEPFVFGKNPRLLSSVGHKQSRPMGFCNDGRFLYVTTRADYGELGGAITAIDPASGQREVFRDFVPTQNPVSCFQYGEFLVGTTEVHGDQGSCVAEAENAVIYVWDTKRKITLRTAEPWPCKSLLALDISPAGRLLGFGEGLYFLFDVESGECSVRKWSGAVPTSGIFWEENILLLSVPETAERSVLQLFDLETGKTTILGEVPPLRIFERLDASSILATANGSEIVRVSLGDTL